MSIAAMGGVDRYRLAALYMFDVALELSNVQEYLDYVDMVENVDELYNDFVEFVKKCFGVNEPEDMIILYKSVSKELVVKFEIIASGSVEERSSITSPIRFRGLGADTANTRIDFPFDRKQFSCNTKYFAVSVGDTAQRDIIGAAFIYWKWSFIYKFEVMRVTG